MQSLKILKALKKCFLFLLKGSVRICLTVPLTYFMHQNKEYVHLEGKRGGGGRFCTQIEPN